jgi:hypothetical protein
MASGQPAQPNPQVQQPDPGFPRDRRFIFVQLLFSLTAAEIARQSAELTLQGRPWSEALPAYTHLLLATAVVVTSWVGWSASKASLRLTVTSVFGWPFLILLTDVFLVILYFILVRGAEIPKPGETLVASPVNEAVTVALIFAGYFAWDVLTKAVVRGEGTPAAFLYRLCGSTMWERGWISFVCMLLGLLADCFLHSVTSGIGVVLVDASLLCLVFLFRAMKEGRWRLSVGLGLLGLASGVAAKCVP